MATISINEFLACVKKAKRWALRTNKIWPEYPYSKCGYSTWEFEKIQERTATIDILYDEYLKLTNLQ